MSYHRKCIHYMRVKKLKKGLGIMQVKKVFQNLI